MASFEKLLRVSRTARPDAVVVDFHDAGWAIERLEAFFTAHLPAALVVILGVAPTFELQRLKGWHEPGDGLALSRYVGGLIATKAREQRAQLRYRDIALDCDRMQLSILPSGDQQGLPLKEAQLLKLFIEHPGRVLKREDIQRLIWANVKITSRTIDSHVSRLRKRLNGAEAGIQSIYGGGYVLR